MTQEKRLDLMISYLMNESLQEKSKRPQRYVQGKKNIFKELVLSRNTTKPSESFLKIQDEYLQEEIKNYGIIDTNDIIQVYDNIYLCKSSTVQIKADIIVNNLNVNNDRRKNQSSGEIKFFSGVQLALELNSKLADNESLLTDSYNLPCNKILNIHSPNSDKQDTKDYFNTCLNIAKENKCTSIVFPSIISKRELVESVLTTAVQSVKQFDINIIFALETQWEFDLYKSTLLT